MSTASKKVFSLALLLTAAFLLLCTGFYTYELLSSYMPSLGQFEKDVFSDVFLPLLYMLALVAFAVFGFLFRTSLSGRAYKSTLASLFAAGFGALATAIWLFTFLTDFFADMPSGILALFGILLILFAITAAAYFVLCATPAPSHTLSVLFGMGAALFALVYAFYAYFDTAFALNSPIKLLDQVCALSVTIFFLAETRFRFGAVSEAVFFPVGMITVLLCGSNAISALVYTAIEGRPLIVHTMHDFLFLGFALYALTRLLSFVLPPLFQEEGGDTPEGAPVFETEGAVGYAPSESDALAQETFDFDSDAESAASPTQSSTEEAEPTEGVEADFDTSPEM